MKVALSHLPCLLGMLDVAWIDRQRANQRWWTTTNQPLSDLQFDLWLFCSRSCIPVKLKILLPRVIGIIVHVSTSAVSKLFEILFLELVKIFCRSYLNIHQHNL
jgi:hypothetical protein